MKNIIEYKNYIGSVEYSDEDETFFGKIIGIRALVSYEGESAKELKQAFIDAVEDYIQTCEEERIVPEKPFKGSFNIRINTDTHRLAFVLSNDKNISLNAFVEEAIEEKINRDRATTASNVNSSSDIAKNLAKITWFLDGINKSRKKTSV